MNRENLRDFAIQAQALIDEGAVEDRIRHYLSSRLLSIFPDYPWWVQAHIRPVLSELFADIEEAFVRALADKTLADCIAGIRQRME